MANALTAAYVVYLSLGAEAFTRAALHAARYLKARAWQASKDR